MINLNLLILNLQFYNIPRKKINKKKNKKEVYKNANSFYRMTQIVFIK